MKKILKYSRPRLTTGRPPKGFTPRLLSDNERRAVLRPVEDQAVAAFDAGKVVGNLEKALNAYRAAVSRQKAGFKFALPKEEEREAERIKKSAHAFEKALRGASSETIKRVAQTLAINGGAEDRAEWRRILKFEYPPELAYIAGASNEAMRRAKRHGGRASKFSPVMALVVDIARIWVDATSQPFVASRQDANWASNTRTASPRKVVHYVLYDVLKLKRDLKGPDSVTAKQFDYLMTTAQAVVANNLDRTSSSSSKSAEDRNSDDTDDDP
ncbi:MAG: hypothetical protein WCP68_12445 [Enhydrobacter sp.]